MKLNNLTAAERRERDPHLQEQDRNRTGTGQEHTESQTRRWRLTHHVRLIKYRKITYGPTGGHAGFLERALLSDVD